MEEDSAEAIFLKQLQFDPENYQELEETTEQVEEDFSIFHRIKATKVNHKATIKFFEKEDNGDLVHASPNVSAITFGNAPDKEDVNGIDAKTEKLSERSREQKPRTSTRGRSKSRRRPKSRSLDRKKRAGRSRSKSKKRTG